MPEIPHNVTPRAAKFPRSCCKFAPTISARSSDQVDGANYRAPNRGFVINSQLHSLSNHAKLDRCYRSSLHHGAIVPRDGDSLHELSRDGQILVSPMYLYHAGRSVLRQTICLSLSLSLSLSLARNKLKLNLGNQKRARTRAHARARRHVPTWCTGRKLIRGSLCN